MDNVTLKGQTALITAGAAAISIAAAKLLGLYGAAVVLMGRRSEALFAARQQILADHPGAQVEIFPGDAMKQADVVAALQKAHALNGSLDIVVSTVGGGALKPVLMLGEQELVDDLKLNIVSAFLVTRTRHRFLAYVMAIWSQAERLSGPQVER